MSISYPLSFPAVTPQRAAHRAHSVVNVQPSIYTGEQTVYVHQGQTWGPWDIFIPPGKADDLEAMVAFLLALNGMEGTFTMTPPGYSGPRGTWSAGAPLVNGGGQSGRTLTIDGISGKTVKAGDWFQLGSGSSTHLHKVVQDLSGNGDLGLWPMLRTSPADNDPLTVTDPKGLWRLATNDRQWDIDTALFYGINFSIIEAL